MPAPRCLDCIDYLSILDMHKDGVVVPNDLLAEARNHIASHR